MWFHKISIQILTSGKILFSLKLLWFIMSYHFLAWIKRVEVQSVSPPEFFARQIIDDGRREDGPHSGVFYRDLVHPQYIEISRSQPFRVFITMRRRDGLEERRKKIMINARLLVNTGRLSRMRSIPGQWKAYVIRKNENKKIHNPPYESVEYHYKEFGKTRSQKVVLVRLSAAHRAIKQNGDEQPTVKEIS